MHRTFVYYLIALALVVASAAWIAERSSGGDGSGGITAAHAARGSLLSRRHSGSRLTADGATGTQTNTATQTNTDTSTATATPTNTSTPSQTQTAMATATTTGTPTQTPTTTCTPTIGSVTDTPTATVTSTAIPAPLISLSTSSALAGAQVQVTGSNFAPGAAISFFLGTIGLLTVNGQQVVSDSNGAFSAAVVIPSSAPAGLNSLLAQDAIHSAVGVTLSVLPSGTPTAAATVISGNVTFTPPAGVPGSSVGIVAPAGSFAAGSSVTVVFKDASTANTPITLGIANASADGSFASSVGVPAPTVAGNATIVLGAVGTTLLHTFTVQPGLVLSASSAPPGAIIQVSGAGFAANATVTFTVAGLSAGVAAITGVGGSFRASLIIPTSTRLGAVAVVASDGTNAANAPLTVFVQTGPTATPNPVPIAGSPTFPIAADAATPGPGDSAGGPFTLSFAEGYTGKAATNGEATFTEVLNLLNPGATAAPVKIAYYVQGSAEHRVVERTVGTNSTLRESVNSDVGPDRLVSAVVTSSERIYATRTITRIALDNGALDGSTAQAARAASPTWYFPEGFTGASFQEYLTLLNTSTGTAHVVVRLAPQAASGANARTVSLTVPPLSRATANIRALDQGGTATSVGMIVSADRPVVAERVEYFGDGSGSGKYGSTVSLGQTGPSRHLRLAYGSSGGAQPVDGTLQAIGDQDYITLLNPSTNLAAAPVQVTVGFSDSSGHTLGQAVVVSVAPGTRQTVGANATIGSRVAGPFSVSVNASGPVVAESAQYYGGSPNSGSTPGVAFPAYSAALLDGLLSELSTTSATGAPISRQVFLYNPSGTPLQVAATYFGNGGTQKQGSYALPSGGIVVVNVNQAALGLPPGPIGAEFRVIGNSGGFVGYAVGRTSDGRSATEDSAALPS